MVLSEAPHDEALPTNPNMLVQLDELTVSQGRLSKNQYVNVRMPTGLAVRRLNRSDNSDDPESLRELHPTSAILNEAPAIRGRLASRTESVRQAVTQRKSQER